MVQTCSNPLAQSRTLTLSKNSLPPTNTIDMAQWAGTTADLQTGSLPKRVYAIGHTGPTPELPTPHNNPRSTPTHPHPTLGARAQGSQGLRAQAPEFRKSMTFSAMPAVPRPEPAEQRIRVFGGWVGFCQGTWWMVFRVGGPVE